MGCSSSKPVSVEPLPTRPPPPSSIPTAGASATASQSPNRTSQQPATTPERIGTNTSPEINANERFGGFENQKEQIQPPSSVSFVEKPDKIQQPTQGSTSSSQPSSSKSSPVPKPILNKVLDYQSDDVAVAVNGSNGDCTAFAKSAPVGSDDPSWIEIWKAHRGRKPGQSLLVDPADVHATVNDLMAGMTNKLSETEMLFLQRKVRAAVQMSQNVPTEKSRKGRLRSTSSSSSASSNNGAISDNPADSKLIAERYHLLTPYVVRNVLPTPPGFLSSSSSLNVQSAPMAPSLSMATSTGSNKSLSSLGGGASNHNGSGGDNNNNNNNSHPCIDYSIQPVETAYILALFCNDSLWDRVADIASRSAQDAGLEMDVNKQVKNIKKTTVTMTTTTMKNSDGTSFAKTSSNDDENDNDDVVVDVVPEPVHPKSDTPCDVPLGVGLHALAFILSLALRGTRQQQLQLLFYLMLPPAILQDFLENHPAGGVPTWLLEVGLDTVISLSSLSHYYWYGGGSIDSPFMPTTARQKASQMKAAWNKEQQDLALYISGRKFIEFITFILSPIPTSDEAVSPADAGVSPNNHRSNGAYATINGSYPSTPTTPTNRKTNTLGFKRRGSTQNDAAYEASDDVRSESNIMQRLSKQRHLHPPSSHSNENNLFVLDDFCSGSERSHFLAEGSSWLRQHPKGSTTSLMNILEFYDFAELAISDDCLKAIMYRIFAHGWIPNPSLERAMVQSRWRDWQESSEALQFWSQSLEQSAQGAVEIISQSVRKILTENGNGSANSKMIKDKIAKSRKVFGGLGGFDGRGGLGYGIMYCINRTWWEQWQAYVRWTWAGDASNVSFSFSSPSFRSNRPGELTSEPLLDRLNDNIVPGSFGSYEVMKTGLRKDEHYVLVPPCVWDILYEIYGGGPPLPRMVNTPDCKDQNTGVTEAAIELNAPSELDLDAMASASNEDRVLRVPRLMQVVTHPWIIHGHLCDPQQPYRRGDAGPMSIRVMAYPDQPLWRLYAEIVVRLPFHLYKAYGSDGRGKARLWKRVDPNEPKDPASRYGPWTLLCKSRFALLPGLNLDQEMDEHYEMFKANWEAFADHATVESAGLVNGSHVMAECAFVNKSGEMTWPRETAAKAGRARQLAEKDAQFRRLLRGLDGNNKPLASPPDLIGLSIDAEDPTGRWYEVSITHVQTVAVTDTEEEDDESVNDRPPAYSGRNDGERKEVRVDFSRYGGHSEWIDIESDRLAAAGRFTVGNDDDESDSPTKPAQTSSTANDTKPKGQLAIKKAAPDADTGKICALPGYGACGLTNLGNTCYQNSAIQCMGYMPLLRSYLLSAEYKTTGDLNRDNPLGTNGKLLEEFADLIRAVWSAKVGEKAPTRFRGQLAKINPQFAGADQQDAQEFLNYMLDVLHEDSNRVSKKPYVEDLADDWVNQNSLLRVGEEAWRRWLRRNRSIMADVAHGQILSTVTCPTCRFSSRKFDPFNLVSVPFPTVAEVIFKCFIYRRASAQNTPWILNKPRKTSKHGVRFQLHDNQDVPKPPSEQLLVEEYVITMSRLADSSDLKTRIHQLCGIPASDLKICRAEEQVQKDKDDGTVISRKAQITPLTDKEGPCSTLARQRTKSEDFSAAPAAPTIIVAFQTTLRNRPSEDGSEDGSDDSLDDPDEDSENDHSILTPKEEKELEKLVSHYGNHQECRLYDTDMYPIAKAVSRSLWPIKEEDLRLGLRVDAIDQKDGWFPGSIVEILETGTSNEEHDDDSQGHKIKVRIHFDNFSNKWDEMKTIDDFKAGRVMPLFSHAVSKNKPTEFLVHHRYTDRITRASNLFGQSFFVQCHSEWSTARAGAQILGQASRFLRQGPVAPGPVDVDGARERQTKIDRLYERTQAVISDLIDLLVDADREYILHALGVASENKEDASKRANPRFRNPGFDASSISAALVKRVNALLLRLPFEVRVCQEGSLLGSSDESAFPFSLLRTIGNFMTVRYAIILQWREPPSDKKAATSSPNGKSSNYLGAPVMYVPPTIVMDEASNEILKTAMNQRAKKTATARGSAGLPLGVCLTEFCKVQELSLDDNWRCPRCEEFRKGRQNLVLWRLPDILTIHIKRFHCSSRWREKITTKVNFPLTGLDMREWCHDESPIFNNGTGESYVYDLIGVINHYGGMTGGHYVATCKATTCSRDGREEVAFDFNGVGTSMRVNTDDETDVQTGWKFGRQKVDSNQSKATAAAAAKAAGDSAEPLWLQFDDELVEPIPPRQVVSETAYVLFYRRRRLAPSNIARYSTLD